MSVKQSAIITPAKLISDDITFNKVGEFTKATVHYIEEEPYTAVASNTADAPIRQYRGTSRTRPTKRTTNSHSNRSISDMNGYSSGSVHTSQSGMYVRALYDYEADDRTSLSFRQGDIIQVITQLDSGWWDGIINGVRGWFPSNYCALISGPQDDGLPNKQDGEVADVSTDEESGEEQDHDYESDFEQQALDSPQLPIEGMDSKEQEEAAFWIPQATPDGRLFYFNTLTGVSTMELPLESPTSLMEQGPRDRSNVFIPDHTRPPPEMLARGYERHEVDLDDEEDDDVSEAEREGESLMLASRGSMIATSMESFNSPLTRSRDDLTNFFNPSFSIANSTIPRMGTTTTSFTANQPGNSGSVITQSFFDDGTSVPLTWNRLIENTRRAVDLYREAINNSERSDFVSRAEDISDHIRLILAAGSATTDNHSGNPSIISNNKALYPHFRGIMSKLSKLVLSSHMAATDWPAPDSYQKCLLESEGILNEVYNYVEVARQQRTDEIPRLVPGFVPESHTGGYWQNNGIGARDLMTSTQFVDQDDDPFEPTSRLDDALLQRVEELRRNMVLNIRRLDEQLGVRDKLVSRQRHEAIGNSVCSAAGQVLEASRPYLSTMESINLSQPGLTFQSSQFVDFSTNKQRMYDLVSDLLMGCQAIAAPLGDEWAEMRGDSLEDRLNYVRSTARQLETVMSNSALSLEQLLALIPTDPRADKSEQRKTDGGMSYLTHSRAPSEQIRPNLSDIGRSQSYPEGLDPSERRKDIGAENFSKGDKSKVKKFFGEVPLSLSSPREVEETPWFLKLDHEGEIAYDTKTEPAQLRGGTLTGLVEHLTRHDKLDAPFNNTLLLTYRSFTTASELFETLVRRFNIQPPPGLSGDELQTWQEKKQKLIRFRVVNILKNWFDNYWMEPNNEASQQLLRRVYAFAQDQVPSTNTPGAAPLMTVIDQRLKGQEANVKRLVPTQNTPTPAPILPKNMKRLKFLDIDVVEFARQLTIIESRLYGKIKPTECLNKTWQKKLSPDDPEPAANVKALILHSNQLTNWVAEMILTQSDLKKRVAVIKHFVAVADKCRSLNNFSTLTSIISALGTAPIHRLNRTWNQVPARTTAVLEQMRKLMGSTKNFGEYRETLHSANPPCIPFFGVYLTDLTFIEDGIPSVIKKTNLINFAKRAKTAEVIRDIQQYQNVPYTLQAVPELQDYILSNMQAAGDVHEMYEQSLRVEPREREDERVARLLNESGFI